MAAEYPNEYTPNPQDTSNDIPGDNTIANASDYNKHDEEIKSISDDLRAAYSVTGDSNIEGTINTLNTNVENISADVSIIQSNYIQASDLNGYATESYVDTTVAATSGGLDSRIDSLESANYVNSLNTATGDISLVEGSNIQIVQSGQNITISAAVSGSATDHNTLANLQGGSSNQYYHLTAAEYDDYIGSSEVASVSGSLDTRITNIESDYLQAADLNGYATESYVDTTVANTSGGLDTRIASLESATPVNSIEGLTGTVDLSGSGVTISTQGNTIVFEATTGDSAHNDLSGIQGGTSNEYYHLTESEYADYIGSSEVATISSGLSQDISNLDIDLQSQITSNASDIATISGSYATESYVDTTVANTSGGLDTRLSSLESATHVNSLNTATGDVNLVEGSNIQIVQVGQNITISAAISGGGTDHNSLANLQGGTVNEYYHLTESEYADYIGSSEVATVSGSLDTRITAIESDYLQAADLNGYATESYVDTTIANTSGGLDSRITSLESETHVNSIEGLTGAVDLSGSGVTISTQGNTIVFEATTGTSNHNDLSGIQGGTVNEYYHLTESEYADYIGSSEVATVSGSLDTRITAIESDYLQAADLNGYATESYVDTTVSNTSGGLDTRITNIEQTLPFELVIAVSDETTNLTPATEALTFRAPHAFTLNNVRASVATAPVGSAIIVDINKNESTVLSTKLSIDENEETSTTATTPPVVSVSSFDDDDKITIDIDQVGSSTPGTALKVTLIGNRSIV